MSVMFRQRWAGASASNDPPCATIILLIAALMVAGVLTGCVSGGVPAPVSMARGAAVVVAETVDGFASGGAADSRRLQWHGDADDGEDTDDDVLHDAVSDTPGAYRSSDADDTGSAESVAVYSIESVSTAARESRLLQSRLAAHSDDAPARVGLDSADPNTTAASAQLLPVVSALSAFENSWSGVRYRWGGNNRSGIDCSALVGRAFMQLFNIQLPRTTREQVSVGSRVKRARLRAGDLVFFRLARGRRHVGVYLGDDRFLHASRSRGVAVSSLQGRYWSRHYWTARRVLDLPKLALTGS